MVKAGQDSQESKYTEAEHHNAADVRETAGSEDVAPLVDRVISSGMRIVEVVIFLRVIDQEGGAPGRRIRGQGVLMGRKGAQERLSDCLRGTPL